MLSENFGFLTISLTSPFISPLVAIKHQHELSKQQKGQGVDGGLSFNVVNPEGKKQKEKEDPFVEAIYFKTLPFVAQMVSSVSTI